MSTPNIGLRTLVYLVAWGAACGLVEGLFHRWLDLDFVCGFGTAVILFRDAIGGAR